MEENKEKIGKVSTEDKSVGKKKKINYWMISSIVLGILLILSLIFPINLTGFANKNKVGEKAVNFINNYLLSTGMAELKGVSEERGLYKLELNVNGQDFESYVTKDGKLLFTSGIDLDQEINVPSSDSNKKIDVSIDDDPVKGDKNAPVTIIEFSDFQCPFCGKFFKETFGQIDEKYIKTGKVKMVFRDFPLSFHENAQKSAEAAECADEQGKFWEYHDMLFENQEKLSVEDLKRYAVELGLDKDKFDSCLDSEKYKDEVKKDFSDGQKYGVSGTPAFFINGKLVSGAQPFSAFEKVIEAELG